MRKTKILFEILFIALVSTILLLIFSNNVNAAELTYSDTAQGVEWIYELDSSNNVINLRLKTTSKTGEITIPSSIDGHTVIAIGKTSGYSSDGAFKDCSGITNVIIPDTVKIIGRYSFYNCSGLTQITLPENLTELGDYAFYNCSGLKSLTIPNSVSQIGDECFYGCSGLKDIIFSSNLTTIGDYAFSNCKGVTKLTMPDTVTTIGINAFYSCSGLKEVTLSKNLTSIPRGAFGYCSGLTSIILPDSVTTLSDNYLGGGAFENCTNLEKILIPDSVSSIDNGVFSGCSKLTIYGNDGQVSKSFAEEHSIKFDYIANWDKESTGEDVTAPTVKYIEVSYNSLIGSKLENGMWLVPAGTKLAIKTTFSEDIKGETVPTLTIKFGEGENIALTEGTIAGSVITYVYTVKNTDNGILTAVDFNGGNIKDSSGNAAILSCPKLRVDLAIGTEYVYANGESTNQPNSNGTTENGTTEDLKAEVKYSTTDETTDPVTVTITANKKVSAVNGWTLSTDGKTLTKSFTTNATEEITLKDDDGKTTKVNISVKNIKAKDAETSKDNLYNKGKIPQTGEALGIIAGIFAVVSLGAIIFIKYKKLDF